MKIYTPNREERAFLYQEAQDLEALMKDLGSLSVMVEEYAIKKGRDKSNYRVTFVLAPESVGMKVQATDRNIFDATIAAKEEAQRQLNAIVNSMPRTPNPDAKPSLSELLH
ncbi:MAG: hypothetical protein ACXVA9_07655 [Bdellovibrionales bacterium]